ncbi:MAG: SusC/RagA family TonB-linked outer membrane protein [Acetivibrio sp.]
MQDDAVMLEDVVVVGFGTQRKENLTGAVATVDTKALENRPISNLTKSMQGLTPGMTITYNSGQLNEGATIRLRGTGTLIDSKSSGSPLILVDGIPTNLNMVNPEDVESISVLKDAASASIYGARGAFGVVLVTTKSGKGSDRIRVSYSGNVGWSNPTKLIDFMDPEDELTAIIATADARGQVSESFGMLHKPLLAGIRNWKQKYQNNRTSNEMIYGEDWENINGASYFYRVWDPNKEMIGKNTPQTTHTLQISGKLSESTTIMASVGYSSKEGVMKINPEHLRRFNANINVNTKITKWLTADLRVMSTREQYEEPYNYYGNGYSGSESNGYFGYYMRWGGYFPYGTYKGTYFRHAPGFMANANNSMKETDYLRLSASLKAQVTKDIVGVAEYSVGKSSMDWQINGGPVQLWNFWAGAVDPNGTPTTFYGGNSSDNSVRNIKSTDQTQVFNAYAKYNHTFGKGHNLQAQIGFNSEWNNWKRTYSARQGLLDPTKPDYGLATGDQYTYSTVSSFKPGTSEYAIAGLFGRFNYDYKGKYLAEFNIRYDGSSKFPTHTQWAWFPSGSIGWRITEEPWMKNIKFINNLKIRASVGAIGNQNVKNNAFIPVMSSSNAYWLGGGNNVQSITYGIPSTVSNDLSWEKITTYDVGLDLGLWNMFSIGFDWYQRNTEGMLSAGKTLPQTFGAAAPLANAGNLRTRGYEISINFNKVINDKISVYATLGLSDSKSIVTKWDNDAKTLGTIYEGMEVGEIWGLTTDRIAQSNDKIVYDKTKKISSINGINQFKVLSGDFKFGEGDIIYKDLDGNGVIDGGTGTAKDHGDLSIIGNELPRYEYNIRLGANLYGFDIDLFFQGVGKRDYWADSDLIMPFYNRYDALYGHMTDYWTPENTGAYYPRMWSGNASKAFTGVVGSNNQARQSKYLLNMAYLRLKNLTVGYTLPRHLTKKAYMEKVRVYFSGENLFTLQNKHLPVDPEIAQKESAWGRTFPYQRTFSFGLQVTF